MTKLGLGQRRDAHGLRDALPRRKAQEVPAQQIPSGEEPEELPDGFIGRIGIILYFRIGALIDHLPERGHEPGVDFPREMDWIRAALVGESIPFDHPVEGQGRPLAPERVRSAFVVSPWRWKPLPVKRKSRSKGAVGRTSPGPPSFLPKLRL